jgi:hypothetical protein
MTPEQKHLLLQETEEVNGKKRLACHKAFQLAGRLNISLAEIGRACEEEGIKIASCQLGCF